MFEEIQRTALYIGVGQASPEEIDEINILNATKNAMRRAAEMKPRQHDPLSATRRSQAARQMNQIGG